MAFQGSILTSASHLVEDFITSGSFAAAEVSACDYGVLDTCTGCAVVISPYSSGIEWMTWQTPQCTWGLRCRAFLRDTGVAACTLTRVYMLYDNMASVVLSGTCINTPYRTARPVSFSHDSDLYMDYGGMDFPFVDMIVQVTEEG